LASRTFREVRAFEGTLPQRITGYHSYLDGLSGEKIRRRLPERLAASTLLVPGAAAAVDIGAVGAVVVSAVGAAEMVDLLAGKGFGGKSGVGDDSLAVGIGVSGVCGFVTRHC
jgi:hypothetical protein